MSFSNIYKIHILQDEYTTHSIHIFGGLGVKSIEDLIRIEPNSFSQTELNEIQENETPIVFSKHQIYSDDTVGILKMKVIESANYHFSLEETYFFFKKEYTIQISYIYQMLTQNGKLELTKKRLLTFLSNIDFGSNEIIENIKKTNKEVISFTDLLEMKIDERKVNINQVLGQKVVLTANEYPFIANPFQFTNDYYDEILERATRKSLTTLNSHLLFTSGGMIGNDIYLCLAEDVLKNSQNSSFQVKLYYPYFMKKTPPILSLTELEEKKHEMREECKNKIQTATESFKNVALFYNIFKERKTDIQYNSRGIKSIQAVIHQKLPMKFPLDVLFKIIHATKENPLIKYNPSLRNENIYRMYSESRSNDGRKIPFLSKSQIIKLKNTIAKTKSIAIYIETGNVVISSLVCEIEENGDVGIFCEFNKTQSISQIDELFLATINPVIREVKNFLQQSGYSVELFKSLSEENIEIKQMNYESNLQIKKPIEIDSIQGCLSSIFILESKNLKTGIEMRFKRVSNFSKTTSQEAFVIEKQKQKYTSEEIIGSLMEKYGMKKIDAAELVAKLANELQLERNVKKKAEIKINPGFKTTIHLDSVKGNIKILVENINDISYLNTVPIYLDSFIRLTQNKLSTKVSKTEMDRLCSKEIKEVVLNDIISLEEEIASKQEIPILEGDTIEYEKDVDVGQDIGFDSDDEERPQNALDLFYGDDYDYGEYEGESDMQGGNDSDDDDEDNQPLDNELINLDGKSLTNPNPFFHKMREYDPILFLVKEQGKFKRYSRACQVNLRRQPVILSQEEYDKINKEKPGFLKENDVIKYGSNPDKPFYYTCPRYWCMKTNMPVDPSELLEKTDEKTGQKIKYHPDCGRVISRDESEIPKGAYIYEFFDPEQHGTQQNYIKHYPGFLTKNPHPDGLCVPCCFKKWQGKQNCNSENKQKVDNPKEDDYIKGAEKFPLDKGRWGFLPPSLEIFLKNVNSECQTSKLNTNIKPNKTCLLRHGVEISEIQSFIACIADVKFFASGDVPSIKEMREIILSAINIDNFVSYQNGTLIESFSLVPETTNVDMTENLDSIKYTTSQIFKTTQGPLFEKIVKSYENFRKFMKDNSVVIDYTYLWDIVCKPNSKLFPQGLNLIILNIPNNDTTSNIEFICPTNHYSNEFYDPRKQSLILMREGNYFEPIYSYRNEENRLKVSKTFSEFDKTLSPELRELFQKVIKPIVKTNCKPLPSMPNVYKFRHAILLENLISLLHSYEYEIIHQVLHLQGKVIGVTVKDRREKQFFVPCFPSSVDSGYETLFMNQDDNKIFSSYRKSLDGLTHLHELSKGKIPCKPLYKIVDDEIVVGILTETNQFIQIVNPIPLSETNDELKIIQSSNYLVSDKDTMLNTSVDDERLEYIQKIKMESQFYIVFRNIIRSLLNKYENSELRETVEKESNLPYAIYTKKLENIIAILKKIIKDNVIFLDENEFNFNMAREIVNCNTLDKDKCNEYSSLCTIENGSVCKMKIPKKNLVTGKNNETFYFAKMADELVRYNRIKSFIFKPYVYLSFGNVDYHLKDNEILLLQSLLTQEYFDNLIPVVSNKYVKYSNFDTVEPITSQTYDNYIKLEENDIVNEVECKVTTQKITSIVWKSCFPSNFTELIFDSSIGCGFTMISYIIEKKTGTKLSSHELKLELLREYSRYLQDFQKEILIILSLEGKKTMVNQVKSESITFQNMILGDSYFITTMDIWILMQKFKIPSAIISSKTILQTNYENYGFVTCEPELENRNMCFIITTAHRPENETSVSKYKLVQSDNGEIFVKINEDCLLDTRKWSEQLLITKYLKTFTKKGITKSLKPVKKLYKLILEEDPIPLPTEEPTVSKKPILKNKKLVLKQDDEKQVKTVFIKNTTRKLKKLN